VPYDNPGVQKALAAQRPLVHGRGPAARALLDLAERVHGGELVLPPEPAKQGRRRVRMPTIQVPSLGRRRNGHTPHAVPFEPQEAESQPAEGANA
jgi:hypothetical protein